MGDIANKNGFGTALALLCLPCYTPFRYKAHKIRSIGLAADSRRPRIPAYPGRGIRQKHMRAYFPDSLLREK